MPIENERKFVLADGDGGLERTLAATPGVTRSLLRQAYLDSSGLRIRAIESGGATRYIFGYKRSVDDQIVEIATEIAPIDFERLWKIRREALHTVRYAWEDGRFHWDVDFTFVAQHARGFGLQSNQFLDGFRSPSFGFNFHCQPKHDQRSNDYRYVVIHVGKFFGREKLRKHQSDGGI